MIILPNNDARRLAIEGGSPRYAHLVNLTIGNTIYRLTSARRDVTIDGTTWLSTPDLVSSSYPQHDSDYQRDFWELQFAEHATNNGSRDRVIIRLSGVIKTTNLLAVTFYQGINNNDFIIPARWLTERHDDLGIQQASFDTNTNCIILTFPGITAVNFVDNIRLTWRLNGNVVTGTIMPGSAQCQLDSTTLAQALFANANNGDDGEMELELVHTPWHARFSEAYATNSQIEVMYAFADSDGINYSTPLIVYKGIGGGVTSEVNRQREYITSVQFTGPLTRLDNDYARSTTQASQQEVDADDTSMNFAHENDTVLTWSA